MKKGLVLSLTVVGIVMMFLLFAVSGSMRAMRGVSANALAGDRELVSPPAPPSAMPMEAAPENDRRPEKKAERSKRKADEFEVGLGLRGAGEGGGGLGDTAGLGSLGPKGGGSAAALGAPRPSAHAGKDTAAERPGEPAATRAWFPETFLFEPLVVTDAQGRANLPVKVPDRLTTWRVLALAHSRGGGQAGAEASFLGTLPTYVEPVTPPLLYAGDEVRLPVQVVNTTEAAVQSSLRFEALGATLSTAGGQVRVPAGGNVVQYVTLTTRRPGQAAVKATLGDTDAVERTIEVQPAGRRELVSKGGTLASPRTFELAGPAEALPDSEQVRLQVFPGALGLVRTELAAAPGRGGVAEDGYLLQLLGQAPALLRSLGAEADAAVVRDLSVLATQRVMRHARAPSVDAATLLAEGALAHPGNPVLSRLGERLALQVAQAQRPDGTCQGADGWTLQRLLVTTAECVRAVRASEASPAAKQRALAVSLKASGAFERNAARVADGYTAAAILASGAVTGTVAERLEKVLLDSLAATDDGAKYVKVESGVVRADGYPPTVFEATALAVLALNGRGQAPVADLGTYLLGGYNPVYGWGDGRTNLVALRAAVLLFRDPVPARVKLTLERDGKPLAQGEFGAAKLKEVVTLDADASGSAGPHTWTVRSEPPVAGLGYSLTLAAYVPWKDQPGGGLELRTRLPEKLEVGKAVEVELTASMPANLPTALKLALPAGVQSDTPSLDGLVSAGLVQRYETEDGAITLHLPPLQAGQVWTAKVKVVPTLGGTLQSSASKLTPDGRPALARTFAPVKWVIK